MNSAFEEESTVDAGDLKAALLECTSRSLLPEKYRDLDRGELIRRTNKLAVLTR